MVSPFELTSIVYVKLEQRSLLNSWIVCKYVARWRTYLLWNIQKTRTPWPKYPIYSKKIKFLFKVFYSYSWLRVPQISWTRCMQKRLAVRRSKNNINWGMDNFPKQDERIIRLWPCQPLPRIYENLFETFLATDRAHKECECSKGPM